MQTLLTGIAAEQWLMQRLGEVPPPVLAEVQGVVHHETIQAWFSSNFIHFGQGGVITKGSQVPQPVNTTVINPSTNEYDVRIAEIQAKLQSELALIQQQGDAARREQTMQLVTCIVGASTQIATQIAVPLLGRYVVNSVDV